MRHINRDQIPDTHAVKQIILKLIKIIFHRCFSRTAQPARKYRIAETNETEEEHIYAVGIISRANHFSRTG